MLLDFSDVAVGESKGQNWESDWHIMIKSDIVMSLATHRWRICRVETIFL